MISLVYSYYRNPGMLAEQYRVWSEYPNHLKAKIEAIVVDDGSPESAIDVARPDGLPKLRIYRIGVDIPWNQDGARNLGAKEAAHPWLFVCDMDHVLPAGTLKWLLDHVERRRCYTFQRLDAPDLKPTVDAFGKPKPGHNIYALEKRVYWSIGGYDETYRGVYGTDGMFRKRLVRAAEHRHLQNVPIIRYSREVISDASTRTLERKSPEMRRRKAEIARMKKRDGEVLIVKTLQFPWERVL